MKVELDVQKIELTKKNAKAEELIKVVQKETEKVKFEKDKGTFTTYKTNRYTNIQTQHDYLLVQPPKKKKK